MLFSKANLKNVYVSFDLMLWKRLSRQHQLLFYDKRLVGSDAISFNLNAPFASKMFPIFKDRKQHLTFWYKNFFFPDNVFIFKTKTLCGNQSKRLLKKCILQPITSHLHRQTFMVFSLISLCVHIQLETKKSHKKLFCRGHTFI